MRLKIMEDGEQVPMTAGGDRPRKVVATGLELVLRTTERPLVDLVEEGSTPEEFEVDLPAQAVLEVVRIWESDA